MGLNNTQVSMDVDAVRVLDPGYYWCVDVGPTMLPLGQNSQNSNTDGHAYIEMSNDLQPFISVAHPISVRCLSGGQLVWAAKDNLPHRYSVRTDWFNVGALPASGIRLQVPGVYTLWYSTAGGVEAPVSSSIMGPVFGGGTVQIDTAVLPAGTTQVRFIGLVG